MSDPHPTPDFNALAARHGLPVDAARHLLDALTRGRGRQAQFNHPALGGMGQWHAGGMTMIGAMSNDALKAKVAALCADLAPLAGQAHGHHEGAQWDAWWPEGLGSPSASGAQNDLRYAVFPDAQRLAVQCEGKVTLYDTGGLRIGGVSQMQSERQNLAFTSQLGAVHLHDLKLIDTKAAAQETPSGAPAPSGDTPSPPAASSASADIPALIERLGELHAKGHLTEAEFTAKKAELLGRV